MTGEEFKSARKVRLKVSQADLGRLMRTPLRTIQDIEAQGDRPVRGVYSVCLRLLIERDQWVMQAISDKIARDLDRRYPNGIASEGAEGELNHE